MLSEDELIRIIQRTVKSRGRVRLGIGDDAAVLKDGTVVTSDAYADGVHFDFSYMSLRQVGERCACGAISDVVAMAAEPEAVLRKVHAALNDNGVFALYLPTRSNWLSRVQYHFFYDVSEHIYRPSIAELEALLERTGFIRRARFAATFLPLRLGGRWFLESVNLYFGVWQKATPAAEQRAESKAQRCSPVFAL